jgi:hypothetical protein
LEQIEGVEDVEAPVVEVQVSEATSQRRTGFIGNVYGGAGYGDACGVRHDNRREESHEYQMKIDLPSFNGHLHIEDFLDWVMEVEQFFDYKNIPKD